MVEIIKSMEDVIFNLIDNLRGQTTVTSSNHFMDVIVDLGVLKRKGSPPLTLIEEMIYRARKCLKE